MDRAESEHGHIEFVDPDTGRSYSVLATKSLVDAAYRMGFIPASAEDMDRADEVDGLRA